MDQIDDDSLSEPAGVVLNEFTIELTGIDVLYENAIVRIGVMHGVLGALTDPLDVGMSIQLQQVGGGGDSGQVSLRGGAAPAAGTSYMSFFDLEGVQAGDQFKFSASSNANVTGYMGAVSIDVGAVAVASVPEPHTLLFLAISGTLGFIRRR